MGDLSKCTGNFLCHHQRFFVGKGWIDTAPGLVFKNDPPAWSTPEGVAALAPPESHCWAVEATDGTDEEGWTYGVNFDDLDGSRGSAVPRPMDVVRQRHWKRLGLLSSFLSEAD